MIQNTYTIDDEHTYSSGTTTQIDIPESGYITEILALSKITIAGGTSVSAAQDALARLIDAMQITAAGGKNYYDITDGRQGFYREYIRRQGQAQIDSMPAASAAAAIKRMLLVIHPGLNPYDPFDRSIVIPAAELSNLKHKVTWGASTVLGSGFTITDASSTLSLTINEIVLEKGERREDIWPQGINVPMFEAREVTTVVASNLGKTDEVPVGNMLNSVLVMILDSSGDRSDSYVTDMGIKFPKQVRTPFESKWYELKARMRALYNLPSDLVGVALIPLQWVSKRAIGLDLSAAMTGDVKLGFTIATASGTLHILYFNIGLA